LISTIVKVLYTNIFKEHSTITDCNEQVSPPTFFGFSKYHIKRINKNRALQLKGEATIKPQKN
jgi:hypothetical protein